MIADWSFGKFDSYSVISFISTFICIYLHNNFVDANYFIVPLIYFLCLLFLRNYDIYSNHLSIRIIDLLMLVRYSIMPVSYYLRDAEPYSFDITLADEGLFLIVYEMICVFLSLNYFSKSTFRNEDFNSDTKFGISFSDFGVRIIIVLFVITMLMYPQYLKNLLTFSFESMEEVDIESNVNGMFNLIYKTGSVVLSCLLLSRLYSLGQSRKSFFIGICVTFICVWICSLGTSGSVSRTSFLTNGIIYSLILVKIFPLYKRNIFIMFAIVVGSMLVLGTISRFYADKSSENFVGDMLNFEMLDSYFGGLRDVVVSIKASVNYDSLLDVETFFNDIFAGVPFFASRSGVNFDIRSNAVFNLAFFGFPGINSRICPLIGQGYIYLGPILAPLFTVFFVYMALLMNKKFNASNDTISFYMYGLLCYFFSAYSMYNLNIVASGFWNKILPVLIVLSLNYVTKKH
ncbi:MAG: hypothetical protein IKP81_02215 [Paludibacteraceae bacterium]|nr:hypothetical protein [Paludibacteraceae bacterium]